MNVDTAARQLLFCTVRVRKIVPGGYQTGTSFLVGKQAPDGRTLLALITNKHVVEGGQMLILDFLARKPGEEAPLLGQNVEVPLAAQGTWVGHPNPDIDVAAIPVGGLMDRLAGQVYVCHLDVDLMPKDDTFIDAIEEVTFIGYPNGHRDEHNRTPIVRRGITATPIELPLNGQPTFLVDGSVFGGSSGSPVFIFDQGTFRSDASTVSLGTRLHLVGIIASVLTRPQALPVQVNTIPHVKIAQELNLGIAFNWTAILELVEVLESMGMDSAPAIPAPASSEEGQSEPVISS